MPDPKRHWRSAAACRSCDPDLFFPVSSSGPSVGQAAKAKQICTQCLVRRECLAFALRTRQAYGVWGGLTEQERVLVLRHLVPRPLFHQEEVPVRPADQGGTNAPAQDHEAVVGQGRAAAGQCRCGGVERRDPDH